VFRWLKGEPKSVDFAWFLGQKALYETEKAL
jgi:hypothetical protein